MKEERKAKDYDCQTLLNGISSSLEIMKEDINWKKSEIKRLTDRQFHPISQKLTDDLIKQFQREVDVAVKFVEFIHIDLSRSAQKVYQY